MNKCLIKISKKSKNHGWHKILLMGNELYFNGYVHNKDYKVIAAEIYEIVLKKEKNYEQLLKNYLKTLNGNFAFIFNSNSFTLAVVDNIASIPIFYRVENNNLILSDSARSISDSDLTSNKLICQDTTISIMMSGYSVGNKTLDLNIYKLVPFEFLYTFQGHLTKVCYSSFVPRLNSVLPNNKLKEEFYDCLIKVMKDNYESIKDKNIVVLLSGGGDSRLIASGLKHIGAENITCLTYGMQVSEEVKVSKLVADRLGYRHIFLPLIKNKMKRYYFSKEFKNYYSYADSYASVPYISEIYQISCYFDLTKTDPLNTVFINGNTGDFINGSHIPLQSSDWQSIDDVLDYVYEKHYSLWISMKNNKNEHIVKSLLLDDLNKIISYSDSDNQSFEAIYEMLEYHGRQSHLIVTNQRTYDFFGSKWRMPLWDQRYVEFWSKVGINNRINSKLYTQIIKEINLAGVWNDIPINNSVIKPSWLVPLRFGLKGSLHLIGKKNNWRQLERNIFYYWLEPYRSYYKNNYLEVLFDKRGQRYYLSWWVEDYLKSHNIYF